MKKINWLILAIIFASFAVALLLYPQAPEKMASHWNAQGEVDGYMGKFWGMFLMPIVSIVLFLLFLFIPRMDPLKENLRKFRKYFDILILLIILFLAYIYGLTIFWNFYGQFNMPQALSPAMGVLFFFIGFMLPKTKRTWFVGIRTPWTLSSDYVWEKTHRLGGKLFMASGLVAILGIVFPKEAIWFAILPVFASTIYIFFYSYFSFKKETNSSRG